MAATVEAIAGCSPVVVALRRVLSADPPRPSADPVWGTAPSGSSSAYRRPRTLRRRSSPSGRDVFVDGPPGPGQPGVPPPTPVGAPPAAGGVPRRSPTTPTRRRAASLGRGRHRAGPPARGAPNRSAITASSRSRSRATLPRTRRRPGQLRRTVASGRARVVCGRGRDLPPTAATASGRTRRPPLGAAPRQRPRTTSRSCMFAIPIAKARHALRVTPRQAEALFRNTTGSKGSSEKRYALNTCSRPAFGLGTSLVSISLATRSKL